MRLSLVDEMNYEGEAVVYLLLEPEGAESLQSDRHAIAFGETNFHPLVKVSSFIFQHRSGPHQNHKVI